MQTYDVPRAGASWDLVADTVVADRALVTGDTEDTAISCTMTHNGVTYAGGAGDLVWEDHDYENAWVLRFLLPPTSGILKASLTVTTGDLIGKAHVSLRVEA